MDYSWEELYNNVHNCEQCPLFSTRTHTVIGDGNPNADIMFIGEGPGHDEDISGIPFVGKAGMLLNKMLAAINIDRKDVYIANIVKCRPPQNRVPLDSEALACLPHLRAQVALVSPKIIVCLGATAVRYCIGTDAKITRDRGKWFRKKGIWFLITYHPAALLRDETKKRPAWEDMKALRDKISELNSQ